MRTIALVLALVLHTSGLWPHISQHARQELTNASDIHSLAITPQPSLGNSSPGVIPVRTGVSPPSLEASTSVLALDRSTATVLYAQNAGTKRPIASITKLITALVILDRHKTSELVTIGQLPAYQPGDDTIGLAQGETYRLGDLISAALIPSANDAADALAIFDSGSVTRFAAQMNLKMSEWGIPDTHFVSASGLADDSNYTTALSLAKIAELALANPTITATVERQSVTLTSTSGRTLSAATTNDLLASGQFYGIKTGYTLRAGECFVGLTKVSGHDIITVVLGSSDRFGETRDLTNWIGSNWVWL